MKIPIWTILVVAMTGVTGLANAADDRAIAPQVGSPPAAVGPVKEAPQSEAPELDGDAKKKLCKPQGGSSLDRTMTPSSPYYQNALKILTGVHARLGEAVKDDEDTGQTIKKCVTDKSDSSPECQAVQNGLIKQLPKTMRNLRVNLALAQAPDIKAWLGYADKKVSDSLGGFYYRDRLGFYREQRLESLTPDERKEVDTKLAAMKKRVESERDRRYLAGELKLDELKKFSEEGLLKERLRSYGEYLQTARTNLFLQHLSSPNPTDADVIKAVEAMEKNRKGERKFLKQIGKKLKKGIIDSDTTKLLRYTQFVESEIAKQPDHCAAISDLFRIRDNRDIHAGALAGTLLVGTVAATIFFPYIMGPVWALGLGVSGYLMYDSYQDLSSERHRALSKFKSISDGKELDELTEADTMNNVSIAAPFVVPLAVKAIAKTARGAAAVTRRIIGN